ncbi:MAG: hypothetical protein ABL957_04955 [Parvularculaceae bacterium]
MSRIKTKYAARALRIATLIASWLIAAPALATIRPTVGGAGGAESSTKCVPGMYVVGLRGNTGSWVDSLAVMCAPLRSDNTLGSPVPAALVGGGGGAPAETMCGANEVVSEIGFMFTKNKQVAGVGLTCVKLSNGQRGVPKNFGSVGAAVDPNSFTAQYCPQGERVVGFHARHGQYVNALGTMCLPLELPAEKPVDVFSRDAQDFHGTWKTEARGVTYEVVLRVSGDEVTGEYSSPGNPQASGTISGTTQRFPELVRLNFLWKTTSSGSNGAGLWRVTTDGRLVGGYDTLETDAALGQVKRFHHWEGSRITRDAGEAAALSAADRDPRGKSVEQCAAAKQRQETRCLAQFGPINMHGCNAEAAQIFGACMSLAAQAQVAAEKVAAEIAADRDPTGKSVAQCAVAYQRNEARCLPMPLSYRPVCAAEVAGIFAACQGLAVQAAAAGAVEAPGSQAGGRQARVLLDVEVYDAANGVGNVTGDLAAGAVVTIVAELGDDWFEVTGAGVPNGRGFVYSGESYRSLKEE